MAVCVALARVALGSAVLAAVAAATPAQARGRHHGRSHHAHRMVAEAQEAPQAWGWGQSWGQDSGQGWGQSWGNNWQSGRQSNWGGTSGWGPRAQAKAAPAPGRLGGGLKALVARHAAANGVPFALADAVVKIESGYNPHARNRSGAMGLMQIKAQTARGQGFGGSSSGLLDPDTNLRFAMRYLATAYRMSGGDVCGTVMRYQSGHFAHHMSGADRSYCSRARQLMAQA